MCVCIWERCISCYSQHAHIYYLSVRCVRVVVRVICCCNSLCHFYLSLWLFDVIVIVGSFHLCMYTTIVSNTCMKSTPIYHTSLAIRHLETSKYRIAHAYSCHWFYYENVLYAWFFCENVRGLPKITRNRSQTAHLDKVSFTFSKHKQRISNIINKKCDKYPPIDVFCLITAIYAR